MILTLIGEKPVSALSCDPSYLSFLMEDLRQRTKLVHIHGEVHIGSTFVFYN